MYELIEHRIATGMPFSANSTRAETKLMEIPPAAVGAAFLKFAREGRIRRIGYVASTDPATHAHPIAEWIGVDGTDSLADAGAA